MRKHVIAMLISLFFIIINAIIIRWNPHFTWLLLDYPTIIVTFGFVLDLFKGLGFSYLILGWSSMIFLHSLVILVTFALCRAFRREMTYLPALIMDVIMVLFIFLRGAYYFFMTDNVYEGLLPIFFNWKLLLLLFVIDILLYREG